MTSHSLPSLPCAICYVIPFYNEEATLAELHKRISKVMSEVDCSDFTICFVDDGSTDRSWEEIAALCATDSAHTQGLRFRCNFGKADALQAGFDHVNGEIVFTMDADLQDDPAEIPAFLKKLNEGYDLVSGWKQVRRDPISKTLPSKVFNALARALSGVPLNDFNCGFKAYRKEVPQNIQLFGELHRFIPILAHAEGFRIGEIPVKHHPRQHGVSKYGSKRVVKGFLDLLTVTFMTRYLRRPAHLFGGFGFFSGVIGFTILAWLSLSKIFSGTEIGSRPLFFLGILLLLLGAQLISIGLIAEMITRQTTPETTRLVAERLN